MPNLSVNTRRAYLLFFLGITLFYFSFSLGSIAGMGYMWENLTASDQITSNLLNWLMFRPGAIHIDWPRHGVLELVFEIPFLLLSRLFFGPSLQWEDRFLAMQPLLMTSLLCTLIFVWVRRITSSLAWSYLLALSAGISTMLWPYAYIGLETTQSFFLLFSAYLVLESRGRSTWARTVLFAFSCAIALGVKLTGFVLVPSVAFLIYKHFQEERSNTPPDSRSRWLKTGLVVSIIILLLVVSVVTRSRFYAAKGGNPLQYVKFMVGGPLTFGLNVCSLLGSPNKGILIYSPVIFLCLAGLRRAYKVNPPIVVFSSLVVAGLVGGFASLTRWADEVWGPRFMHALIGPLFLCLALAKSSTRFRIRREVLFLALVVLGVTISLLGTLFYYGALHVASINASQNTVEALLYDISWNHLRFNFKLLVTWVGRDRGPVLWPHPHQWEFVPPPDISPEKRVDLRPYAVPQPEILRYWTIPNAAWRRLSVWVYLCSFSLGLIVLVWLGRRAFKEERYNPISGPCDPIQS